MFKALTGGTSLFGAAGTGSPTPKRTARQRPEKGDFEQAIGRLKNRHSVQCRR